MRTTGTKTHFDVIIGGGGMIGTSLALALSPLGLRIAVVEAVGRKADSQPSFDDRSTALSRSSQRMFEAMMLWPDIVAASAPIRRIHVSDKGRFGFSHIDAEDQNVEALGYVVINRILGSVLQNALENDGSVHLRCPARIDAVRLGPNGAEVSVVDSAGARDELTCHLLVAADGAKSTLRDMMGIGASVRRYGQHAVVGNLRPEKPIADVAYERFTEQGPLALLPVAGNRAAFVWTVSENDASRVLGLDDDAFLAELQAAFGFRLGALSKVGRRAAYPLMLSRANRLTASHSVLIGNAAHGLHPVAAQGFNLGLRDVASLCDCIVDCLADHADVAAIGDAALLDRYARWRESDQRKLVQFTDGLVRLFGSRRGPVRALRDIGMLGFDLVPGVQRAFARQTMGLAGRLPRLSRGVPLT